MCSPSYNISYMQSSAIIFFFFTALERPCSLGKMSLNGLFTNGVQIQGCRTQTPHGLLRPSGNVASLSAFKSLYPWGFSFVITAPAKMHVEGAGGKSGGRSFELRAGTLAHGGDHTGRVVGSEGEAGRRVHGRGRGQHVAGVAEGGDVAERGHVSGEGGGVERAALGEVLQRVVHLFALFGFARHFSVSGLDAFLLHGQGSVNIVQLVVEPTGIADGVPVGISSPESRRCGLTVCTGRTCPSRCRQPSLGLNKGSILSVHFVVEPAGVAQVVTGTISAPQWGGRRPAVDALPAFCAGPRLGPRLASEAGGGAPQQAAGREESGAVFGDVGRVGGDGVVGGRRRPSQGGHAAAGVRRLELHAVGQRHLVLDAFLLVLAARAGRARGGQGRVRGDVLRRGGREGEEVRAGVTRRQGGGRGRGVDRQGPRGAVVDGRLGERAEVPGRGGVVAAQGFAAVQPGQGSVQERGTAHLTPVVGRRVPLHGGPHRVSVVGRDVVALTVDVKKYIHLLGQGVLRRVHVGVAEARVVRVRVLPVEDRGVVVAHPTRLVRRHLHGPGCARALSPGPEPARGEGGRSGGLRGSAGAPAVGGAGVVQGFVFSGGMGKLGRKVSK